MKDTVSNQDARRSEGSMKFSDTPARRSEPSAEGIEALETTAVRAARRAAEIQLAHFRRQNLPHTRLLYDVKLEVDRLCEEAIVATIRERFSDHAILTEERGWLPGTGDVVWIVDPLDGTVNFWHGLPFFCVSIACYQAAPHALSPSETLGAPLAGVVLLPYANEIFTARAGHGAFFNGHRLHTPPLECMADAVVSVSFGKTPAVMDQMTRRLNTLLPKVRKARCLGAAAAELCYTAAGFLGGTFYEGLKLWDFAAARIIIQEAGGFLAAAEAQPDNWRVLAGGLGLRDTLGFLIAS
jgi:fructose-1,6-bisphosphatase/inositol monophosphatase family enzyme